MLRLLTAFMSGAGLAAAAFHLATGDARFAWVWITAIIVVPLMPIFAATILYVRKGSAGFAQVLQDGNARGHSSGHGASLDPEWQTSSEIVAPSLASQGSAWDTGSDRPRQIPATPSTAPGRGWKVFSSGLLFLVGVAVILLPVIDDFRDGISVF
ncbi:hypothetical protein [Ancrocorticia sp.]|uniref:hypothetical protein n=1 Tax=Ancrocorticia sp. TaxID=2593684 RepID=UPI003F913AA2